MSTDAIGDGNGRAVWNKQKPITKRIKTVDCY